MMLGCYSAVLLHNQGIIESVEILFAGEDADDRDVILGGYFRPNGVF